MSYALQIYVKRFCVLHQGSVTKLREHQVSFHSSQKRPNCSVFALLLQLSLYYFNNFSNYCHYCKSKFAIWAGIPCKKQADCIIHHGGSLLVAASSRFDSIGEHQDGFPHSGAGTHCNVLCVGTTEV